MKNKIINLILIVITFCVACYKNPMERNTILFKDNVENVQNSLSAMQKLLAMMPKSQTSLNTNYYYQDGDLYINNSIVGNPDSILLDTVKGLTNFSSQQKKKFVQISKYLERNYITAGYSEKDNLWFFINLF